MSSDIVYANDSKPSDSPNLVRAGLGCFFLLPAIACCIGTLLVPTIQTISTSMTDNNGIKAATNIGLANYTRDFQDPMFGAALKFSLLLLLGRIVAVAIIPPILAIALNQFGRAARVPVRLLYSIPLALFAPISLIISWRLALNPQFGLFGQTTALTSPNSAPLATVGVDSLTTFGIACGVGLVAYLIALRGTGDSAPEFRRVSGPLLVTWLAMIFSAIALSLQSFVLPYLLTNGGPGGSTTNLGLYQYLRSFRNFQLGVGSSIATMVLVLLLILGLIIAVIVVATKLNLQTVSPVKATGLGDGTNKLIPGIVLALGTLGSGTLCALSAYPQLWTWVVSLVGRADFFRSNFSALSFNNYQHLFDTVPMSQTVVNTILPALVGVILIQLPVSYFGALGIGGLRPLGRRSEWLLLLFSPWLFVTILPLSVSAFQTLRTYGLLNTLTGLVTPILVNIPMLFILTLFFKGKTQQWRNGEAQTVGSFFQNVILPSLPLALLLGGIAFALGMQDSFWPLIAANSNNLRPLSTAVLLFTAQFGADTPSVAAMATLLAVPTFVFSFVVFAAFQIFYLDRLALGMGETPAESSVEASKPLEESVKAPPFQIT